MDSAAKQRSIAEWLGTGSINIFGLPFSGKDTQAIRLAQLFRGQMLSGGDILRGSKRTKLVAHISTGNLAPTDEYLEVVLPFLSQEIFAGKPLILSSVGRWHGEEDGVLKATAESGHPVRAVIFLNMDQEHIHHRFHDKEAMMHRGDREDDDLEVLETRLKEFHDKTQPVINFYRGQDMLIEVDGNLSREEVTTQIINKLYAFANPAS